MGPPLRLLRGQRRAVDAARRSRPGALRARGRRPSCSTSLLRQARWLRADAAPRGRDRPLELRDDLRAGDQQPVGRRLLVAAYTPVAPRDQPGCPPTNSAGGAAAAQLPACRLRRDNSSRQGRLNRPAPPAPPSSPGGSFRCNQSDQPVLRCSSPGQPTKAAARRRRSAASPRGGGDRRPPIVTGRAAAGASRNVQSRVMTPPSSVSRTGEYAERGDYHRRALARLGVLSDLSRQARTACARTSAALPPARACSTPDAAKACSSTSFTDRLADRRPRSRTTPPSTSARGSLTALPYATASFDRALCLDVLEHLSFHEQAAALAELFRVVAPGGELLRHGAESRASAVARALPADRAADPHREPRQASGRPPDRASTSSSRAAPASDWSSAAGIFPTVPVLTRLIRRSPARLRAAASAADAAAARPGLVLPQRAALRAPLTQAGCARSRSGT